jgi:hypothetical protein
MLSVMPTFRCTAACMHCGTFSSPKEETWLPIDVMLDVIDQAAEDDFDVVAFTGGEATLAETHLTLGMERAAAGSMIVRLVTNAWWAKDDASAAEHVARYQGAGMDEINLSTGDQHVRFVDLECVIRATGAALAAGLPVGIMVEVKDGRELTEGTIRDRPDFQQLERRFPDGSVTFFESPWAPMHPGRTYRYPEGVATNRANLSSRSGCDSVLTTTTLQADGRLGACCGLGLRKIPELNVGDAETTTVAEARETAANDFLKHWIRVDGPERILAWASDIDPGIEWEDMYGHRCQACLRLYQDPQVRSVVSTHHQDKMSDVLFREWLLYNYGAGEQTGPKTPS